MRNNSEENKKSPARQKKEAIVAEISTQLASAKGVVFANYQGLTHKQIEDLKKNLKEASATFTVTKNTLLKLSLGKTEKFKDKVSDEIFNDPTAVIFISGDPIEALKKLAKATKDFGFPKLKSGILDGTTLDEAQLIKLSTLPNRNTLLAQLVGTLNSPIQGLVVVLNGNLQKLVMVLSAVAKNKPIQADVSPAPEPQAPAAATSEPVQTEQTAPIQAESVGSEPQANEIAPEPVNGETVQGKPAVASSANIPTVSPTVQTPTEENKDQAQVSEGGES